MAGQVPLELGFQQRQTFAAPTTVADGVLAYDLGQDLAVFEFHRDRVGNRAFSGVVIIGREGGVFHAEDSFAQRVDARVGGDVVFVVVGREAPENERYGNHVLHTVIAVGRILEGT